MADNSSKGHYEPNPCKEIEMDTRSLSEIEVDEVMKKMLKTIEEQIAVDYLDKPTEMIGS